MNSTLRSEEAVGAEIVSSQLLVDVSVILRSDAQTGIQRVVRALLRALLDADLQGYVVRPVYATRKKGYTYASLDEPLFMGCVGLESVPVGPVSVRSGDIFLALDLAANILPLHRRQLATWRRSGCRIATVMYDLLPALRPDWFNPKTRRNYRSWLGVVTKHSDQIICISRDVADELGRWVAARPWRGNRRLAIDCMRLGSDLQESAPSRGLPHNAASIFEQLALKRMLLVVGTIEPRKGHDCLLPAFELLWGQPGNDDLLLVVVGRPGWKTEQLQVRMRSHPERGDRFFWFDDASDEFLNRLYALARGVIVPSHAEGFGLPLAEAVGHGVPVLARELPVFKAMQLVNVTYYSRDEPQFLAASIKSWMDGYGTNASSGNLPPTWSESFADLLKSLSIKKCDDCSK